jgi:hypothetical protein
LELIEHIDEASRHDLKLLYDKAAFAFVKANVEEELNSGDELSSVGTETDESGYYFDRSEAEGIVASKAKDMLLEMQVESERLEIAEIVGEVDLDRLMEPYMTADSFDDDERRLGSGASEPAGSEQDQIDVLFERS